jgi:hypothetical protein
MLYFAMPTLKNNREHAIQTPLDIMGAKNVNLGYVGRHKEIVFNYPYISKYPVLKLGS